MKTLIYISFFISLLLLSFETGAVEVPITTDLSFIDGCGSDSCNVPTGFSLIMSMMWGIIKYFTYLAGLSAVLFIVVNGILYSMAGINESLKTWAKDRIMKTLIGLVILMLSGVILNTIAPWIYK